MTGGLRVRTNVVLIDLENVKPSSLERLSDDFYRVIIFVGAQQSKLPFEMVSAVHRLGDRAEYVQISGTGRNALDFHIAFYIGQIAAQDPTAFFHIISKDTGYDPLIKHLKSRHVFAARSASIDELPLMKMSSKQTAKELARVFAQSLRQPKSTKPRTDKTLARHISSHFQKLSLAEAEIASIVSTLQDDGLLQVDGGKVSYSLG